MTAGETPWHREEWFTSPWNHDDEVASGYGFPDTLQIHDVTLRDGEQQAGVEFSADEKLRIAEALDGAGVHRIEAGLPAVSPEDTKAVKEIARAGFDATIYAFARCLVDDVKRAVDCGVEGVVMEIPSSRHLIELGYRWSVERALALSIEATQLAHENGLRVTFFPIDATRASVTEYLDLVTTVARDGHVDALALVDTFGVLAPQAVERFVRVSRERLGVPLETHFHMDYGLGVANTLLAAAAGADVLQVAVSGLGERAGNTPLEETVVALRTLYDRDIGLRLENLTELAHLVGGLSGVQQPSNRPVVGDRLFAVESGIIASWLRNVRDVRDGHLTEVVPYLPSLVGQEGPHIVLGKNSGIDSIVEGLELTGQRASAEERLEILSVVKERSLAKRDLLDLNEFRAIVEDVTGSRAG